MEGKSIHDALNTLCDNNELIKSLNKQLEILDEEILNQQNILVGLENQRASVHETLTIAIKMMKVY